MTTILLVIALAVIAILITAVLIGRHLTRRAICYPPPDIHTVLDDTGEQVDATVFPLRGRTPGRP